MSTPAPSSASSSLSSPSSSGASAGSSAGSRRASLAPEPQHVPLDGYDGALVEGAFVDDAADVERSGREGVERLRLDRERRHARRRRAQRQAGEAPPERPTPETWLPTLDLSRPEGGRWQLARIYFDTRSPRLHRDEVAALARVAGALATVSDGQLHVVGYADVYGETAANAALALERALSAVEILAGHAELPGEWLDGRLVVEGRGERGDPDDARQWRRVDVVLVRERVPPPEPASVAERQLDRTVAGVQESPAAASLALPGVGRAPGESPAMRGIGAVIQTLSRASQAVSIVSLGVTGEVALSLAQVTQGALIAINAPLMVLSGLYSVGREHEIQETGRVAAAALSYAVLCEAHGLPAPAPPGHLTGEQRAAWSETMAAFKQHAAAARQAVVAGPATKEDIQLMESLEALARTPPEALLGAVWPHVVRSWFGDRHQAQFLATPLTWPVPKDHLF